MPSPDASRRNLEKALARWRAPRPWRSEQETRVIKRIIARWLLDRKSKCSGRRLAERLSVSQAYLWKLSRKLAADPTSMLELVRERRKLAQEMVGISADGQLRGVESPNAGWDFLFQQVRGAQERSRQLRLSGQLRTAFKGKPWPRSFDARSPEAVSTVSSTAVSPI